MLAGPTCDSIDVIAENMMLPKLKAGDLVVGRAMGAYTWASATEFNFFPRATVVSVNSRPGDSGSVLPVDGTGGRVIDTVVFDIGWVLVRLDPQPILELLARHGGADHDLESLVMRVALHEHETGRLHGQGLLERLAALATAPVTAAPRAPWLDMFELRSRDGRPRARLSERHRVYLLSNIGDLHWVHLSREYGLHPLGHGALPSYLAGGMKPHAAIYAEAERRFALEPRRTVFIDDRADNIAAARARGWHGIVHADYASTRAALRAGRASNWMQRPASRRASRGAPAAAAATCIRRR